MNNRIKLLLMLGVAGLLIAGCGEAKSSDDHDHQVAEAHDHDEVGHDLSKGDHEDDDHDEHGGHDEHGDVVSLNEKQIADLGIEVSSASVSGLATSTELPAEIRLDENRVARLQPSIEGIVQQLLKSEGDHVEQGETLALISSRELADLKAEYLAAKSDEVLAQQELTREETLFQDKITAEADLLTARANYQRARTEREAAETKLHALGIGHDILDGLSRAKDGALSVFAMTAPISGQIAARSLTLGQSVSQGGEPAFVIVDTSQVWADIAVYKDELDQVELGDAISIESKSGVLLANAEISFVSPIIDERTRTATARAVIQNEDGKLRPGQFVRAHILGGDSHKAIQIPSHAIQLVEGKTSVFVPTSEGFEPRPVVTGEESRGLTEIREGLATGDVYVSDGAFSLKAELEKSAFGDGHAH